MADGTLAGLRRGEAQTYWDPNKEQPYGKLRYNPLAADWRMGPLILHQDDTESTATKLVLRASLGNGEAVKIIIPQAQGALTPAATARGIVHICPFYKGPEGCLEYQGSLFIFFGGD